MCRGEVTLCVPHGPVGLDLLGGQLVRRADLHCAVDDLLALNRLEVAHLEDDDLELEGEDDVRLGEGGDVGLVVVALLGGRLSLELVAEWKNLFGALGLRALLHRK